MSGRVGPRLTGAELDAVALAAEGLKIRAIARRLSVTEAAVQSRLRSARLKSRSARTTALIHAVYTSGQLKPPAPVRAVPLSADQTQVLKYLAQGLTAAGMRRLVTWPQWRLFDAYADLLADLDASDSPAYAIKRAWAMGHLGREQGTT
ncbi:hypothetical protein ABTX82_40045 [Streptomyces lavendulae]|uniref:hypothetical protein n=1 Tax=Streptomyces lavendulae TaxID=1914 RepID=UPI0033276448